MMSNIPDLRGVDLNLLVALDALLDARSVREAARRLHLSPSATSHLLGRLRRLFDDELLVRSGRGMVLSRRGEALREPTRALLAQARALLVGEAPIEPRTLARAFRVVCTDHVSTVLLGAVEARLSAEAPGVDLYVQPLVPEAMEDLRLGRADAAIGVFPEAPPEMRARRLFEDRFVCVCRQDHPRLREGGPSLAAYLAEEHVLVAPRGVPSGTVDEVLARSGQRRRVARTFPSFLAALWNVAATDRLLTVSARLVAATASTLHLSVHPAPLPLPGYSLSLLWHPRTDRSPAEAWLRALLIEEAARLPPLPPDPPLHRSPPAPGPG